VRTDAYPNEAFEGRIYALEPSVDEKTRTVVARAEIPNKQGKLRPGMFGRVNVLLESRPNAVIVPEQAICLIGSPSREKRVELKGFANLVTIADKESEALIIGRIRDRYPNHAILAEESGASGSSDAAQGKWIIDPLDGTTNFAHQYPFFCVSIGFERDGEIQCGAVYDPWRDELFTAERGHGAFMNGHPLTVSDADMLRSALIMTGFPYGFREKIKTVVSQFEAFLRESQAVRRVPAEFARRKGGRTDVTRATRVKLRSTRRRRRGGPAP